jgi:hypothetical protein
LPSSPSKRTCKDCETEGLALTRPAPHVGPRCATHNRANRLAQRTAAHARRLDQVYSITAAEYAAILESQGGKCAICNRATGTKRRLAVDHDHSCCNGPTSCGNCVRGLLCKSCNTMLGRMRDDAETFTRAAEYLTHWPSGRGPS